MRNQARHIGRGNRQHRRHKRYKQARPRGKQGLVLRRDLRLPFSASSQCGSDHVPPLLVEIATDLEISVAVDWPVGYRNLRSLGRFRCFGGPLVRFFRPSPSRRRPVALAGLVGAFCVRPGVGVRSQYRNAAGALRVLTGSGRRECSRPMRWRQCPMSFLRLGGLRRLEACWRLVCWPRPSASQWSPCWRTGTDGDLPSWFQVCS